MTENFPVTITEASHYTEQQVRVLIVPVNHWSTQRLKRAVLYIDGYPRVDHLQRLSRATVRVLIVPVNHWSTQNSNLLSCIVTCVCDITARSEIRTGGFVALVSGVSAGTGWLGVRILHLGEIGELTLF